MKTDNWKKINILYNKYEGSSQCLQLSIFQSTTKKMQRFLDLFIYIDCSTCFRRFLRPSSGAQNVHTASIIVKTVLLPAAIVDEMERSSISSIISASSSVVLTIPNAVCTVLCS
jgi:hypothetical protein